MCFVRRVLAVLKLSQLAAICADFCTFGCDLDCSAGVLLVVSRLASYSTLMSPWRNLLSRCEMSFRVVTLSGSGFGASMSCSNNMTSNQMGVGS